MKLPQQTWSAPFVFPGGNLALTRSTRTIVRRRRHLHGIQRYFVSTSLCCQTCRADMLINSWCPWLAPVKSSLFVHSSELHKSKKFGSDSQMETLMVRDTRPRDTKPFESFTSAPLAVSQTSLDTLLTPCQLFNLQSLKSCRPVNQLWSAPSITFLNTTVETTVIILLSHESPRVSSKRTPPMQPFMDTWDILFKLSRPQWLLPTQPSCQNAMRSSHTLLTTLQSASPTPYVYVLLFCLPLT